MNILLPPINDFIFTKSYFFIWCGCPWAHVLKVANELTLQMIKVQHSKLYATHYKGYDDSFGIGLGMEKLENDKVVNPHCLFLLIYTVVIHIILM